MFKSVVIALLFVQSLSFGKFQIISGTYSVSALDRIPDAGDEYIDDNNDSNGTIYVELVYNNETSGDNSDDSTNDSSGDDSTDSDEQKFTTEKTKEITTEETTTKTFTETTTSELESSSITNSPPELMTQPPDATTTTQPKVTTTTTRPKVPPPTQEVTTQGAQIPHRRRNKVITTSAPSTHKSTPKDAPKATQTSKINLTTPKIDTPTLSTRKDTTQLKQKVQKYFAGKEIKYFDKPAKYPSAVKLPEKGEASQVRSFQMDFKNYLRLARFSIELMLNMIVHPALPYRYPIKSNFKETLEYYYSILLPEMDFTSAKLSCTQRNSKFFELTSHKRLLQLNTMTTSNSKKLNELDSENWSILIWQDIDVQEDGSVWYQSGRPLYAWYDEFGKLEPPSKHEKGKCLAYDVLTIEYTFVPCDTKLYALCYIEKDHALVRQVYMHNHLRSKITELKKLEVIANLDLSPYLARITNVGVCPDPESSLTNALGLDEPVGTFSGNSFRDIDVFYDYYDEFKSDLLEFEQLIKEGPERLREIIGIPRNFSIMTNHRRTHICFPPMSDEFDPEEPKEKTVPTEQTPTPAASATPTKTSPSTNLTEYYIDTNYLKLTFYEAITAVTSITISLIAICNCAWVTIIILKNRKKNATLDVEPPFSDLELTPMLERKPKIKFGTDDVREFDQYGSTNTLPSPAPIQRKKTK